MPRLILHVGAPKCGSTYLQRVLLREKSTLSTHGIGYPHKGQGHPGNGLMIYDVTRPWLAKMFEKTDTLILSHEALFSEVKRAKRLRHVTEALDVDVQLVAFLRPFSEIVFGDISQALKQRFDTYAETRKPLGGRGFRQFVWARHKDFAADTYLRKWAELFPQNPIHVGSSQDIPATMRMLLPELPKIAWDLPLWRRNPSLPAHRCEEALAHLAAGRSDIASRHLAQRAPSVDWAKTPERIDWIEDVFAERNASLLKHFGYDNRRHAP